MRIGKKLIAATAGVALCLVAAGCGSDSGSGYRRRAPSTASP